ncbi:MAG TPA: response regulator [Opitutaceae bacterium]|nr:response regulator [Opitutaceae bacterium]
MAPLLSWLETWTAYQDYGWFLALLAWMTVVGGAWLRRMPDGSREGDGWLVALGFSMMAWPVLELSLLVSNLQTPYRIHDFLMGLVLAAAGGILAWRRWGAGLRGLRRWLLLSVVIVGVLALSVVRAFTEIRLVGACLWAGAIAAASLAAWSHRPLWRASRRSGAVGWLRAGTLLVAFLPVLAPHGVLAVWAKEPRLAHDLSHFAWPAVLLLFTTGAVFSAGLWRRRLSRAGDFRLYGWALLVWALLGLGFVVWTGYDARRAFEDNLVRRASMAAALLDQKILAEALRDGAPVASVRQDWYTESERPGRGGVTVEVATLRAVDRPAFVALRAYLRQLKLSCPDVSYVSIVAPWSGRWVTVATSADSEADADRQLLIKPGSVDLDWQPGQPSVFCEGPLVSSSGGSIFRARAILTLDGAVVGQLLLPLEAAVWGRTFLRARLQAMALVGVGFVLWGVALAYRSRRAELQAVQAAAEQATAADRMKSAFLAKVSHELRTPIQSVLGYGELLELSPVNAEQRHWLKALRNHGETMLRLVNDLIDLGSLQTGLFRLQVAPVSLSVLVPECVAALSPQANRKGLSVSLTVAPDVPDWVAGDAVRLRQILVNLIANAVKYTPRGQIAVSVRWADESAVHFVVADTGPGIPPAKRADLFRPFTRLTSEPEIEGSGVGLALVAGLCAAMGGRVYYEEGGPGATFVAALPLQVAAPPTEPVVATTAATFGGMDVVLADDNPLVRELLATYLRSQGAEVRPVCDGLEALVACEKQWPDVLLLDLSMPRMDGLAAAQAVRERADGRPLRIVGLSAHAQAADEAQARQAGMDAFLVKPVSLGLLSAAISPGGGAVTLAEPEDPMAAVFKKLRRQYAEETPALLEEMRAACRARDWPCLRRHAHYLKNSADVLRLVELQAACQKLFDWTSQPSDPSQGDSLFNSVEQATNRSLT